MKLRRLFSNPNPFHRVSTMHITDQAAVPAQGQGATPIKIDADRIDY
jgi:hypothetical protein